MSTGTETVGICLVGQVTTADTGAIEAGLNELWRLAEAGEVGGSVVRAASMTFLVPLDGAGSGAPPSSARSGAPPSDEEADADDVTALLDDLTATHPFRAVLLLADERLDEPRARLCSHLRRGSDGDSGWYWEEIRLVSPGRALHQVMSSVATLALPNLPLQTWWRGEPAFDSDLYNHIAEVSDRIIVDSSGFRRPTTALPQLASVITAAHESIAFADLSWTRLTPWRTLTAEFFDRPSDQALLDSIERVTIEYVLGSGGEASQALFLVGWLASRLGWEPQTLTDNGMGGWRFQVVDGVRPVQVEIVQRAGGEDGSKRASGSTVTPGLRAVTIVAAENERWAWYSIERWGDGEEARTIAEVDGVRLEGHAHLPVRREAELLQEELGGFTTDRIYQDALTFITRLLKT